ncbi:MAG: HD domain-containing protein, partial [bacterium]
MKKIQIIDAEPGMMLARPVTVLSAAGRELIPAGAMLHKSHIKKLRQWGIEHLYIQTIDDDKPSEQPFNDAIRLLANQTYEDAIFSLARLTSLLREKELCDLKAITESVSHIIEVVSMEESILSLLSRIRTSDEYLYRHSVDVCVIALIIGKKLGLGADELRSLGIASLLHDIGMMKFKKDAWDKCMLTAEPGNIRRHPADSQKIARKIKEITPE